MVTHRRLGSHKEKTEPALKPFIAWDGEGEHAREIKGKYLLFGCSTGKDIQADNADTGLRASQCFELMIQVAKENPDSIHVAFAFSYDVSMMVESLPFKVKEKIAHNQRVWWRQYSIEYQSRKWFKLYDKKAKVAITLYDIFTFFACSAIKAWKDYLPRDTDLRLVSEGKGKRTIFTYNDLPFLRQYMHLELVLYVRLIEQLRTLLLELGVKPRGWYGPGAAASAFLSQHKIKEHMSRDLPDQVIQASQYAYFGGRFEAFRTGTYYGKVYKSDIRSAYPHALRHVPSLQHGTWNHRHTVSIDTWSDIIPFSLYRLSYRGSGDPYTLQYHNAIAPFPYRDFKGSIHYPRQVDGWYWGIEVQAALKHAVPGEITIHEAWEFTETDDRIRPFAFIEPLFKQRQIWKGRGKGHPEYNPVELAAKLCMNSIYGKLAQRVGKDNATEPPTWHQLEYSGFATAYCRAMVYDVMASNPDAVIAVETDGIFSTAPLDIPADTKQLGDWEVETFDGISYVQSGVYVLCGYGHLWSGRKMRGFSRGDFSVGEVLRKAPTLTDIDASTHRFASLKAYWNDKRHTQWIDNTHTLKWGGGGKRLHDSDLCRTCLGHADAITDGLHDCYIGSGGGESEKHALPWRIDNRDRMIRDYNAVLLRQPRLPAQHQQKI